MKSNYKIFLVMFLITIFSLVVYPGYSIFVASQEISVPALYMMKNSSLFPHDIITSFNFSRYSLFNQFVIRIMNLTGLDIFYVFFILSLIFRFICIFAVYYISRYFTESEFLSLAIAFLTTMGLAVYGTTTSTFDYFMMPRTIGLPLAWLSLFLLIIGKPYFSAIALGAGLLIHPLTVLPFIFIFYLDVFLFFKNHGWIKKIILGLIPLGFLALLVSNIPAGHLGIFSRIDQVWEGIIRWYIPEMFISSWPDRGVYLQLIATVLLFFLARVELKSLFNDKEKKKYLYFLFFIPVIFFIVAFIAVDMLKSQFFLGLQLARSLIMWRVIVLILFVILAYKNLISEKNRKFYGFLILGTLFAFIFRENFMFMFLPPLVFLWLKYNFKILNYRVLKNQVGHACRDSFGITIKRCNAKRH